MIAIVGITAGTLITIVSLSSIALHVLRLNWKRSMQQNQKLFPDPELAGRPIGMPHQASNVGYSKANTSGITDLTAFKFNWPVTSDDTTYSLPTYKGDTGVTCAELYGAPASAELYSPASTLSTARFSSSPRMVLLDNNASKTNGGENHTELLEPNVVEPNATYQARPASRHHCLTASPFILPEGETQSPYMADIPAFQSPQFASTGSSVPTSRPFSFEAIVPTSVTQEFSSPNSSRDLLSENYSYDRLESGEIMSENDDASHQLYAAEGRPPSLNTSHRSNFLRRLSPATTAPSSTHRPLLEHMPLRRAPAIRIPSAVKACPICDKVFRGRSASGNLKRHENEQHPDQGQKKKFLCNYCRKDYSRSSYLLSHPKCEPLIADDMYHATSSLSDPQADIIDTNSHPSTRMGDKRK